MRLWSSRRRLAADEGSGSVLALAIVAAVVIVALATMSATAAFALRQRVVAAADAAALAAADVRLGIVAGEPCTVAGRVARAHGAQLAECVVHGGTVTVTASAELLGVPVRVSARAGPPRQTQVRRRRRRPSSRAPRGGRAGSSALRGARPPR